MHNTFKYYVKPANGKRVIAFSQGDANKLMKLFGEGAKLIRVPVTR